MTEKIGFDEFVTVRSPRLLRLAYLLTQDHALAEDLLQTALARSWSAWRRIDGNPEPYVRRVLVNTHNSWWRRHWRAEQPVEELPVMATTAPQTDVDERDGVWRALRRLPQQQRAVLVLRYFEDMSEAEIAQTLGLAPGTVKSYAAKGLAKLRIDPTLSTLPLPEPVETPAGTERLEAVRHRIRRRRRDRIVATATAIGVVVALILGYALAPHLRDRALPPPPANGSFPDYIRGYHMVASGEADFADVGSTSFTWTPGVLDIRVHFLCGHDAPGVTLTVAVAINGSVVRETTCIAGEFGGGGFSATIDAAKLRQADAEVGRPATVTMSVGAPAGARLPHGRLAIGIAEFVPFDQVPLPSRPATLKPLPTIGLGKGGIFIKSTGPHEATMRWDDAAPFVIAQSQTPGILTIKINGIPLSTTPTWWDYNQLTWHFNIHPKTNGESIEALYGKTVTISVEAEHMTGDWSVAIGKAVPG